VGAVIQSVAGGINNIAANTGSENARDATIAGAQDSAATQTAFYDANVARTQPYVTAGNNALSQLSNDSGPNGSLGRQFTQSDFQQSPAYAFNMQQGLNAINNSQSVRGGALSGGAQKAATGYAQQNASNEYQNAYSRFTQNQQQNYNQLSGLSNMGLSATNSLNSMGTQQGSIQGGLQQQETGAQAQDFLNHAQNFVTGNTQAANAWSGGGSGTQGLSGFMSSFATS
jgi:hypothetical protein